MITSSRNPDGARFKGADRQSWEFPRLMVLLVVILALVNVSATVLMAGSWVSLSTGMLEPEMSMQDRPAELVD
ncbi:MAG TPA: hypothetical protein VFF38_07030 [Microvirga sp.]|nr:hypothetical protein [Microvirga sp.]